MPKTKTSSIKCAPKNLAGFEEKIRNVMKDIMSSSPDNDDYSNMETIIKRYKSYIKICKIFLKSIMAFIGKLKEFALNTQIKNFTRELFLEYKKFKGLDLEPYKNIIDFSTIPSIEIIKIKTFYDNIKKSNIASSILIIAKNLKLSGIENMSFEEFYASTSNIQLMIFYKINLKGVKFNTDFISIFDDSSFSNKFTMEDKKEIYAIIKGFFSHGENLKNLMNTPDFDTETVFSSVIQMFDIITSDIKGCDRSKEKVKNSFGIFQKNTKKYMKNFVNGNPVAIFSDFFEDIIGECEENDEYKNLIVELRTILIRIRKKIPINSLKGRAPQNIIDIVNTADKFLADYEVSLTETNTRGKGEIEDAQKKFSELFIA